MTNVSPNAIAGTWARSAVAVLFGVGLVFSVAAARAENSGSGGASPVSATLHELRRFAAGQMGRAPFFILFRMEPAT